MSIYISMLLFTFVGAVSPGPVNVISTASGARAGYRKTFSYVLGSSVSYTCIVFLVGIGLEQVEVFLPVVSSALKFMGGGYLLLVAYRIATSGGVGLVTLDESHPSFIDGTLVQGLNPKAWLVAMSGVTLFVISQYPAMQYLTMFCIISFVMCFLGVSVWAVAGSYITRYLSSPVRYRLFNITMGCLLGTTVILMLVE